MAAPTTNRDQNTHKDTALRNSKSAFESLGNISPDTEPSLQDDSECSDTDVWSAVLSEVPKERLSSAKQTLESSPEFNVLHKIITKGHGDEVSRDVFNYYESFADTGHLAYRDERDLVLRLTDLPVIPKQLIRYAIQEKMNRRAVFAQ